MYLRTEDVKSQIGAGKSKAEIMESIQLKYEVSERQAQRYWDAAFKELQSEAKADAPKYLPIALERYNRIFRTCITDHKYREALTAQGRIDELMGLTKTKEKVAEMPEVIKIGVTGENPLKVVKKSE